MHGGEASLLQSRVARKMQRTRLFEIGCVLWCAGTETRAFLPPVSRIRPSNFLQQPKIHSTSVPTSSTILWIDPSSNEENGSSDTVEPGFAVGNFSDAVEDLPLRKILRELDRRGTRYAPTATRADLIRLLHSDDESPKQQPSEQQMNLQDMITELERRDIRFSPTASRSELELLLEQNTNTTLTTTAASESLLQKKQPTHNQNPNTFSERHHSSLARLLEELDRRNIHYAPTASRAELEALLRNGASPSSSPTLTGGTKPAQRIPRKPQTSMEEILQDLDRLNIPYSPTASRTELIQLLRQYNTPRRSAEQRRRLRQRQSLKQMQHEAPLKSLLFQSTKLASKGVRKLPRKVTRLAKDSKLSSRLSSVTERAARQARRVKRRASDFWAQDEHGIREAEWYRVSQDNTPIDVPAIRIDEAPKTEPLNPPSSATETPSPEQTIRTQPRTARSGAATSGDTHRHYQERIPRRYRRPRAHPTSPPSMSSRRPSIRNATSRPSLHLPPAPEDTLPFPNIDQEPVSVKKELTKPSVRQSSAKPHRKNRRPRRKVGRDTSKRIYAQYEPESDADTDVLDRVGNMLADSAEKLLWGPEDERARTKEPTEERPKKSRHWKDRLAEQVDYALGIHEDGKYYNSWEKQLEEVEQTNANRANSRSQKRRSAKPSTAFWEDEGSLLTLLFGRTKSGRQLAMDRFLDSSSKTTHLTSFFKSAIQVSLLVASYTCRWASVRGAVPQPIVVMLSAASLLTARRGRRLWTLALTLLAIRTVGELIHGYVYGDQDWEDSEEEEERQTEGTREED